MKHNNEKTALIAMSGGVDSSVSAVMMLEKGYKCMGATMKLYDSPEKNLKKSKTCCSDKDIYDAAYVAIKLGMPYEIIDLSSEFKDKVILPFIRTYEAGGTPNPCIECNRYLKFVALRKLAKEKGYDNIVTGHYAQIEYNEERGRYLLKRAVDSKKDQSYVLYSLTQDELAHTIFPLGGMTKEETRNYAESHGLINAEKGDSQDICFVPDGDYVGFMERYQGKKYKPGDFVSEDGKVIGQHKGAVHYTTGQRKGLGIAAGMRIFVYDKDMEKNLVFVGSEDRVFSKEFIVRDVNWISVPDIDEPVRLSIMTRYRGKEAMGTVEKLSIDEAEGYYTKQGRAFCENPLHKKVETWANCENDSNQGVQDNSQIAPEQETCSVDNFYKVTFDAPQRAITPGQAAVFYDNDYVFGGGTIDLVIKDKI